MLPDGDYEAFVTDASATEGGSGAVSLDLAIVAGDHKGEVVSVQARGLERDDFDLLGLPATLHVENGQPRVTIDE